MNEQNTIMIAVATVATVAISGLSLAKTIKQERKKRSEIEANLKLDTEALARATAKVRANIQAGKYNSNFNELVNAIHENVAFEKIAIRY